MNLLSLKRIIPQILLKDKKVVKDFDDLTVINENPIALVAHYNNSGADEVFIYNMATEEEEKEEAFRFIKRLKKELSIPLIVGGGIEDLRDVKKALYAGANKVVISLEEPESADLLVKASDHFGKERIVVAVREFDTLFKHLRDINERAKELIILNVLDIDSVISVCDIKCIVCTDEKDPDILCSYLKEEKIKGITGTEVSKKDFNFYAFKERCKKQKIAVSTFDCNLKFADFRTDNKGLIPVIVQHYRTQNVLMMAYMNEEAFNLTIKTGKMTYYNMSRKTLWVKGETTGEVQYLKSLKADCDKDTLLAKVEQVGATCHTGSPTCFINPVTGEDRDETNPLQMFVDLYNTIVDRRTNPKEGSYTNYLFSKGTDKILKKIGEEATEIIIASKNPNTEEIKYEISDFLYHLSVLMVEKGITWEEIVQEMGER